MSIRHYKWTKRYGRYDKDCDTGCSGLETDIACRDVYTGCIHNSKQAETANFAYKESAASLNQKTKIEKLNKSECKCAIIIFWKIEKSYTKGGKRSGAS